jgi:hypothetical protein
MGSKSAKLPQPSSQERELQQMQLDLLKESRADQAESLRMQNLLAPHIYGAAGLKPRYDAGKIVGFDETADPMAGLRQDLEKGYLERSLKAQRGELEVDPALEREIGESQRLMDESLQAQLGPGFATSTPGIQAQTAATQRTAELRSAARRGELSLNEQLGLAREGANQARATTRLGSIGGTLGLTQQRNNSQLMQGISAALGPYAAQRQAQFQANAFNAQQPSGLSTALGIGSTLLGTAAGSFLSPFGAAAGGMAANALFGAASGRRGSGYGSLGSLPFG